MSTKIEAAYAEYMAANAAYNAAYSIYIDANIAYEAASAAYKAACALAQETKIKEKNT